MAKVCTAICYTQILHTQQPGKIVLTGSFSHFYVSSCKRVSKKTTPSVQWLTQTIIAPVALEPSFQMLEMPLCGYELSLLPAKQPGPSFPHTFRKFLNAPETISYSLGSPSCSLCPGARVLPLTGCTKCCPAAVKYLSPQLWFHRAYIPYG